MIVLIFSLISFSLLQAQERITLPKVAKRRCIEQAHYRSCYEVAHLYHLAKKKQEAEHFAIKGCEMEYKESCSSDKAIKRMIFIMKKKKEWDKSVEDAIKANPNLIKIPKKILEEEKSCFDKTNIKHCGSVGVHFQFLQSPVDIKRAVKAYKFGCENGDKLSCSSLRLLRKGIGKTYIIDM